MGELSKGDDSGAKGKFSFQMSADLQVVDVLKFDIGNVDFRHAFPVNGRIGILGTPSNQIVCIF